MMKGNQLQMSQRPPATLPKPFRGASFRQLQVEHEGIYAECGPYCQQKYEIQHQVPNEYQTNLQQQVPVSGSVTQSGLIFCLIGKIIVIFY